MTQVFNSWIHSRSVKSAFIAITLLNSNDLMLCMLGKNLNRQYFEIFLFFPENRL